MFEEQSAGGAAAASAAASVPPASADILGFCTALAHPAVDLDDAARLERMVRLTELKAAVAAAQAVETAAFVRSRREVVARQIAAAPRPGVGTRRRLAEAERAIVADVAVARRESPGQASRFIGFALTAPAELPAVFGQLAAGRVNERRVHTVHHTTAWLSPAQRRQVDADVAGRWTGWGDRQVLTETAAAAYRADPVGACERVARAEQDRGVSQRPAPESMTRTSMLLPLVDGVAVWAALDRAAKAAAAAGDPRTRRQMMADTAVERITGRSVAVGPDVEVNLVMTDAALRGDGPGADEPVRVVGHGWLPAGTARDLVLGRDTTAPTPTTTATTRSSRTTGGGIACAAAANTGTPSSNARPENHAGPEDSRAGTADAAHPEPAAPPDPDTPQPTAAKRAVRRMFTDPAGHLIAGESRARCFTPAMRELVRVRDDVCRTPWCDAPIREIDHVHPAGRGGPTAIRNARGLCTHCNLTAQADGMTSGVVADAVGGHTVFTVTPMGRHHRSRPPDVPGARPLQPATIFADVIWFPGASHHAA